MNIGMQAFVLGTLYVVTVFITLVAIGKIRRCRMGSASLSTTGPQIIDTFVKRAHMLEILFQRGAMIAVAPALGVASMLGVSQGVIMGGAICVMVTLLIWHTNVARSHKVEGEW